MTRELWAPDRGKLQETNRLWRAEKLTSGFWMISFRSNEQKIKRYDAV